MQIVVGDGEFIWMHKGESKGAAPVLGAPAICICELIEVRRNGAGFDSASILYLPAQGHDGFEGFEALLGEHTALKELTPSMFEKGDEIIIDTLRSNLKDDDYWSGMTSGVGAAA